MARYAKALSGKYGKLTIISNIYCSTDGQAKWLCICDCGSIKLIPGSYIKRGIVKSCGCIAREKSSKRMKILPKTHGKTKTPEYKAWQQLKHRCLNKNNPQFHRYGGRGISVSYLWVNSFESFFNDVGNKPSDKYSIDRIDNNKNYEPGNCKWSTKKEQANNRCNSKKYRGLQCI